MEGRIWRASISTFQVDQGERYAIRSLGMLRWVGYFSRIEIGRGVYGTHDDGAYARFGGSSG